MKKEKVIKRIFSISIIFLIILICFSNSCIAVGGPEDFFTEQGLKIYKEYKNNPDIIKKMDKAEVEKWIEILEREKRLIEQKNSGQIRDSYLSQIGQILTKLETRKRQLNQQQIESSGEHGGTSGGGDTGIVQESPAFSHGSWINPDDFNPGELSNADDIINKGNIIIGALKFVGMVASILALITLGIKYMVGSVEEKAEYKQTMWPYIVGTVLLFGTTTVLSIIEALAKEF